MNTYQKIINFYGNDLAKFNAENLKNIVLHENTVDWLCNCGIPKTHSEFLLVDKEITAQETIIIKDGQREYLVLAKDSITNEKIVLALNNFEVLSLHFEKEKISNTYFVNSSVITFIIFYYEIEIFIENNEVSLNSLNAFQKKLSKIDYRALKDDTVWDYWFEEGRNHL